MTRPDEETRKMRPDHRVGVALHRMLLRPFRPRTRFLLVLGTMRSGSTLLTNILASNPEITGFAESFLVYDTPERLFDLRYWAFRYRHRYPRWRDYLLDKVLHSHLTPDLPMLLSACDARVIFILRDPAVTARSIARMYEKVGDQTRDSEQIAAILEERYGSLARMCGEIPSDIPVSALSYEALTSGPEETLAGLSAFLGLREPLSSSYQVERWVGRWGLGDGSDNIRSGELIARARPVPDHSALPGSTGAAFDNLKARLAERCDSTSIWL